MLFDVSMPPEWGNPVLETRLTEVLREIVPEELLCVDGPSSENEGLQIVCRHRGRQEWKGNPDAVTLMVNILVPYTKARDTNCSDRAQRIAEGLKREFPALVFWVAVFLCPAGYGKA